MSTREQEDKKYAMDHEYDGIKELNYPLPKWWLITFYGAIIFGIGYFSYYTLGPGKSIRENFEIEKKEFVKMRESYLEKISEFDQEKFNKIFSNEGSLSYGEELYKVNCQSCHNSNGIGLIGPNLVDNFWLYSDGTPEAIYPFVLTGNPEGGMPSWYDKLEKEDIYSIIAFLMSKNGMMDEKSKSPQGEEFPKWSMNQGSDE